MSLLNLVRQNLTDILKHLAAFCCRFIEIDGDILFFRIMNNETQVPISIDFPVKHRTFPKTLLYSFGSMGIHRSFLFSHRLARKVWRLVFHVKDQWIYFPCGNLQKLGRSWIWWASLRESFRRARGCEMCCFFGRTTQMGILVPLIFFKTFKLTDVGTSCSLPFLLFGCLWSSFFCVTSLLWEPKGPTPQCHVSPN